MPKAVMIASDLQALMVGNVQPVGVIDANHLIAELGEAKLVVSELGLEDSLLRCVGDHLRLNSPGEGVAAT